MLKKSQKVIPLLLKFIILGFFVVITLYPVFWMISGSEPADAPLPYPKTCCA